MKLGISDPDVKWAHAAPVGENFAEGKFGEDGLRYLVVD